MCWLSIGILVISLIKSSIELFFMRDFDVINWSHIAFMMIMCAMFSFGIAAIYTILHPFQAEINSTDYLAMFALLCSLTTLVTYRRLNHLSSSIYELAKISWQ